MWRPRSRRFWRVEQAIETPWKSQLTALQAQDAVFTTLGTDLSTLTTSLQSLTDFNGVLAQKQGSSSDTNVLALTSATAAAVAGSHTIVVNYAGADVVRVLRHACEWSGHALRQPDDPGPHDHGGQQQQYAGVAGERDQSGGIGVNASVITDVSGSRLSLVSGTSGSAGQLTITSALPMRRRVQPLGFILDRPDRTPA